MIISLIFSYLIIVKLDNNNTNNKIIESNAVDVYETKINLETELKMLKNNEDYLLDQINMLESVVKEVINQKKTCLGLCW